MKWIFALLSLGVGLLTLDVYGVVQSNDGTPEDDTIDGEFTSSGYNNPTEVTHFEFKELDGTSSIISGSSLTPQQSYYVKLEIYDRETLADVTRVAINFFDNSNDSDGDTFRGSPEPNYNDAGQSVVMGWDRGNLHSSQGAIGLFDSVGPGFAGQNMDGHVIVGNTKSGIAWEIIQSTAPAVGVDDNLTEAAFEFIFKISRVAREGSNNWQFGYYIQDGVLNNNSINTITNPGITPGSNPDAGRSTYSMQWYGEINAPTAISWSGITPGVGFSDSASVVTGTGFEYFINGGFEIAVQISNQWTPSATQVANVQSAQLTEAGIIDSSNPPQAFAMELITQGATGTNGATRVAFTPNPSDSNDYSNEIVLQTTPDPAGEGFIEERGISNDPNRAPELDGYTFYLKTSTDLQNATYSGEIKFTLRND